MSDCFPPSVIIISACAIAYVSGGGGRQEAEVDSLLALPGWQDHHLHTGEELHDFVVGFPQVACLPLTQGGLHSFLVCSPLLAGPLLAHGRATWTLYSFFQLAGHLPEHRRTAQLFCCFSLAYRASAGKHRKATWPPYYFLPAANKVPAST